MINTQGMFIDGMRWDRMRWNTKLDLWKSHLEKAGRGDQLERRCPCTDMRKYGPDSKQ